MIQINIPMPEACDVCPFNYDFCWCKAFGNDDNWKKYSDDWNENVCERTTRPEYCPLKEQEAVSAHWDDDTGHWIEGDRNGIDKHTRITGEMIDTFRCSWCGFYQYWKTPFCPNCGAKMEGR